MHDYSIYKHPREKVVYFLSFGAITIAPPVNIYIKQIITSIDLAGGIVATTISISLIFRTLLWLFDSYFWKITWLRKFMLVPDLNGEWSCDAHQFLKNGANNDLNWQGTFTIVQSWSKIVINLKTSQSSSKSISASISKEDCIGYRLLFVYENNPKPGEDELHRHTGTCEIVFDLDLKNAEGSYFTDQNRNTAGNMKILRKEKNIAL